VRSGEKEADTVEPAGDLRAKIGITPFTGGRAMHVKDGLRACIDKFRDLQFLYAVTRSLTVVTACDRSFVERGVDSTVF
jgi:hypothetical protein